MHLKQNPSSGYKSHGEGFDWETAPWFDANGLNDVAPMQASTQLQKLQEVG